MPVQLVAIDLDGTTVGHDFTISPAVRQAVLKVNTLTPVKVVVATGRMHPSALPYAHQLQVETPVISYQGGMVKAQDDAQTTLHHSPIALPAAQAMLTELLAEGCNVNVYVDNVLYTNQGNNAAAAYAKMAGVEPVIVDNLLSVLTGPPTKMLIIDAERLDVLMPRLRLTYGAEVSVIRSRPDFCELISAQTSKWAAVSFLAQQWGIHTSSILAAGDQENDLSMIEAAGVGVAMGNAPLWIQERADVVAPSVEEDGLATILNRYVLQPYGVLAN